MLKEPLLVDEGYFNTVMDYFQDRNVQSELSEAPVVSVRDPAELAGFGRSANISETPKNQVGFISLMGATCNREMDAHPMSSESLISYESLEEQAEGLLYDPAIGSVVLYVDSPGGEAYRCFESARNIRAMADDTGKKLIAYVDGTAASAGYAMASIADEVIMNPDSMVGSIGVVVAIESDLKKRIAEGQEIRYITYGEQKRPFEEDGSLKAEFIKGLQDRVNMLGDKFVSHVESHRPMTYKAIKDTDARMFSADEALELGLADSVMEINQFQDYLVEVAGTTETIITGENMSDSDTSADVVEALQTELAEYKAVIAKLNQDNFEVKFAQFENLPEGLVEALYESGDAGLQDSVLKVLADNKSAMAELQSELADAKAQAEVESEAQEEDGEMFTTTNMKVDAEADETTFESDVKKAASKKINANKGNN